MFMVIPDPSEILKGMVPRIPEGTDSHLILAGLVGTTMAAVVLVSRTYLVAEQKWTLEDLKVENRDASVSLVLTFLVSASILATAAGTMYPRGIIVDRAIDMVKTLEPIAGPLAASVFVLGIMAAAFSSLFPNYLLGPWLLFDFRNRPRKMNRTAVRFTVLGVALLGLIVPLFKGNPVIIMIASQAVSPVMMPLLILFVFLLINNRRIVGDYKNPLIMNIGLGLTFLFSLFMAYTAYIGLSGFLSGG
jgi:manganese transport protein